MRKGKIIRQLQKFQNLQGFVWKTIKSWLDGKSFFPYKSHSFLATVAILMRYTDAYAVNLTFIFSFSSG